jgi:hypothetical protein
VKTISLITHCTTRVSQVLDVHLVHGQLKKGKISGLVAGGGKIRIKRNVVYILPEQDESNFYAL